MSSIDKTIKSFENTINTVSNYLTDLESDSFKQKNQTTLFAPLDYSFNLKREIAQQSKEKMDEIKSNLSQENIEIKKQKIQEFREIIGIEYEEIAQKINDLFEG